MQFCQLSANHGLATLRAIVTKTELRDGVFFIKRDTGVFARAS